jgi:hypothetical protein
MKNDVTIMRVIISLITPFFTLLSFIVLLTSRAFHTYSQSELPLSFSVPFLCPFLCLYILSMQNIFINSLSLSSLYGPFDSISLYSPFYPSIFTRFHPIPCHLLLTPQSTTQISNISSFCYNGCACVSHLDSTVASCMPLTS